MTQEQKIIRAKVGPAFDVRTGVRLTPRWREPDSNHGSREGVVGAFANFPGAVYSGLAVPRSAGETLVVYAASKKENHRGRH